MAGSFTGCTACGACVVKTGCPFRVSPGPTRGRTVRAHRRDVATLAHLPQGPERGSVRRLLPS
ncbi:hypothetical protein SLNWT_2492 [Streptomyces albus]|uniref:Uncharacterized protein n=1 Tax=Streptomyces albus (strain ATCC 21838 / DSM 41398 / FERM P-419 / JCM 4703 / NBRC 107858) TaxID=1081613 RepID=A0A0B5EKR4_STRA4|nr:hypothetical protein SLNWT_2492 [Streptomyces albus]AOU77179.1 hypothetical protein SLNHY_2488 [Streptomyces albus]AYN32957.1 hypothetical protein DUI70_2455 [Streptomyces albus]